MKKTFLALGILCLTIGNIFSQSPFKITQLPTSRNSILLDGGGDYLYTFASPYCIDLSFQPVCKPQIKVNYFTVQNILLGEKLFVFSGKSGSKEIQLSIADLKTCQKEDKGTVFTLQSNIPEYFQYVSPSKQVLLLSEKAPAYHCFNKNGEHLWSEVWNRNTDEGPTSVVSVDVDDEGNALFFVRISVKGRDKYEMVYRSVKDGKFHPIIYTLDLNGSLSYRAEFDKKGLIHFIGTYVRNDVPEGDPEKKGFFHGKTNPHENNKLVPQIYPIREMDRYESRWALNDFFVDDDGKVTVCATGLYLKKGAGQDFSKVFMVQMDNNGEETWSHLISTINLSKDGTFGYRFVKAGPYFLFIYHDNSGYLKYDKGIDVETMSSEPLQNQLQGYVVNEAGKLSKALLYDGTDFRLNPGSGIIIRDNAVLLLNHNTLGFVNSGKSTLRLEW